MSESPKGFLLNVGGTRYEVSDSLLDRFPDSMLRKITSDIWNQSDDDSDTEENREIFIERNGGRFKYVLDFMRDSKVALPLSVPRLQFINDMEYYGLDFEESQIIPDTGDSDGMLHKFSEFSYYQRRFKDIFGPKRKELDVRYRDLAAESLSYAIALVFFKQVSEDSLSKLEAREVYVMFEENYQRYDDYKIEELQPHLNEYGLIGSQLTMNTKYDWGIKESVGVNLMVTNRQMDTRKTPTKKEKVQGAMDEVSSSTKQAMPSKRIKINVGGTRYEVSRSLLNRFPDSKLSRITLENPFNEEEIFIDRDGGRFEFVLDYMRDNRVVLPLTIFRPQLVSDLEYFGIDFDNACITLGVADPNDMFHQLSKYYYEKERFKEILKSKTKGIKTRFRRVSVESVSCAIASAYFEEQFSAGSFTFEAKKIRIWLHDLKERSNYSIDELQPHLNLYGLSGSDIEQREEKEIEMYSSSNYYRHSKTTKKVMEVVKEPSYIELRVTML